MGPAQIQNSVQVINVKWDKERDKTGRAVLLLQIINGTNGILRSIEADPLMTDTWQPLLFDPPIDPREKRNIEFGVLLAPDGKPQETLGFPPDKRWQNQSNMHRNADIQPFNRQATFAQEARTWIFDK